MYFLETGLGEVFKPRPQEPTPPTRPPPKPPPKAPAKPASKGPPDRFIELYTLWDLWVPFKKDFTAFSQEAAKAIGRHVSPNEKAKIDSLVRSKQRDLKAVHGTYGSRATESNFVHVRVSLRFTKNNHTGLDWMSIETALPLKDSVK